MKTANNLILSRVIAPRKDDEHLLNMALIGYVRDENNHPLHAVSIDCEPPLLGMPYFKLYSTANRHRARCVARSGESSALSLLFPMEKLFERYVAQQLRKFLPAGFRLSAQD